VLDRFLPYAHYGKQWKRPPGTTEDGIERQKLMCLAALAGESIWPRRWLETVQQANLQRVNLRQTALALVDRALKNGTVRLDQIGG